MQPVLSPCVQVASRGEHPHTHTHIETWADMYHILLVKAVTNLLNFRKRENSSTF